MQRKCLYFSQQPADTQQGLSGMHGSAERGGGSEKAPEALPTALEAESRNRRPQRQAPDGQAGRPHRAGGVGRPSLPGRWLHKLLGSLWANFTFLVFMNHFPSGGV